MLKMLNAIEMRVLGALIEKDLATPEYYPLTLNSLTAACNQKSNRDPVMALDESDVVRALDSLKLKRYARQSAEGIRAAKYCHSLSENMMLEPADLAILAELLLRGPQTLGELRTRGERMCPLTDLETVEKVLDGLMNPDRPMVCKLPRQAGRKEARYAQLFGGVPEVTEEAAVPMEPARRQVMAENERVTKLEEEVAALRGEVVELQRLMAEFKAQFE
jgi:uncharacterized protein YceH (UPF0502 family)